MQICLRNDLTMFCRFQLDVRQVFTKPVILIRGMENITKILQLFSLPYYNLHAKIEHNVNFYSVVVWLI